MFSKPDIVVPAAFALIAPGTEKLKIGRVIGPAIHDGYDVVDLKFALFLAGVALAVLLCAHGVDIGVREAAAILGFSCLSVLTVGNESLSPKIGVSGDAPTLDSFILVRVLFRPFERSLAVAGGVVRALFASPFRHLAGTSRKILFVPDCIALEAASVAHVVFVAVSVLARTADGVVRFARQSGRCAVWVLSALGLTPQRVRRSAPRAQSSARVALNDMSVSAGLPGEVEALSGGQGRLSLRNFGWHAFANITSVSTGFGVARDLLKGEYPC